MNQHTQLPGLGTIMQVCYGKPNNTALPGQHSVSKEHIKLLDHFLKNMSN